MKMEMESNIRDAMRTSDFNEVVLRVNDLQKDNVEHGSLTVSAGYDADGNSLVTKQTISYTDSSRQDTIHSRTETTTDTVKAVGNAPEDSTPVASSENGLDVLLKKARFAKGAVNEYSAGYSFGCGHLYRCQPAAI